MATYLTPPTLCFQPSSSSFLRQRSTFLPHTSMSDPSPFHPSKTRRVHRFRTSTVAQYKQGKAASLQLVYVREYPFLKDGMRVPIPLAERRHLRARRVKAGSTISLFDGRGAVARGIVSGDFSFATVVSSSCTSAGSNFPPAEPGEPFITVCCCPPQSSSRADWLVEKLTELGVVDILWILSERSEVRNRPAPSKLHRWGRLAVAASKQSMRTTVPEVRNLGALPYAAEMAGVFDVAILLSPNGAPLLRTCSERVGEKGTSKAVLVIAGPEGGFTREEEHSLIRAGCFPASLGPQRLRIETALLSAISGINAFVYSQ